MRVTDPPASNEPSAFEFECRGTSLRLTYYSDILRIRSDETRKKGGKRENENMNETLGDLWINEQFAITIVSSKFAHVLIITNSTKAPFNQCVDFQ